MAICHVYYDDYYSRSDFSELPDDAQGDIDFDWMFRILSMVQFGSSVIFLFTRKLVRSNLIHDNIEEFGCAGLSTALSLNGLVLYLPIIATSALAMTFLYGDIVYHINNTMKAAWGLLLFGGVHCIWSLFCVKIVKVLVLLINSF